MKTIMLPDTKICTNCKTEKPGADFVKLTTSKDGLYSWCRSCTAEKSKAHYYANREKRIAQARQWQAKNPERFRELVLAARARYPKISPEEWIKKKAASKERQTEKVRLRKEQAEQRKLERRTKLIGQSFGFLTVREFIETVPARGTAANIVPACLSCNSSKGDRPPQTSYQPHLLLG